MSIHAFCKSLRIMKCHAYQSRCRAAKATVLLGRTLEHGCAPHLLGDCEVDEVSSNAHLRKVVRVGQLGRHVQLEINIIVNIGAPEPNEAAVALAGDSASQQWQQLRLQAATHLLHLRSAQSVDAQSAKCANTRKFGQCEPSNKSACSRRLRMAASRQLQLLSAEQAQVATEVCTSLCKSSSQSYHN